MWLYSSIYFRRSFVVQLLSCVQFFATPWTAACQALLSFTISQSCSSALIRWRHPSILFSVIPFSSCPQSFPVSRSFPVSQLLAKGLKLHLHPQSFQLNIQGWFLLRLTGLLSLLSKGFSRIFSNTTGQKHQFFSIQPSLWSYSHICTWLTTGKTIALTI